VLILAALTAALLALILVTALVAVLVFVMQTRAFMAQTSAALEVIDEGASRLANRLQRLQGATEAAAGELATAET
jgi:hypothetical protein